jgi:hypothetical protein
MVVATTSMREKKTSRKGLLEFGHDRCFHRFWGAHGLTSVLRFGLCFRCTTFRWSIAKIAMVEAPIIPRITVEPSARRPSLKVRAATATSTVEGQMVFPARSASSQQASHCREERASGLAAGQHSRWSFR